MSEDAKCIICGRTRPISEMRFGSSKVEVGSHVTNSVGGRSGSRRSISFGGSSGTRIGSGQSSGNRWGHATRRDFRRIPGWACKSHGRFGRILGQLLVVSFLALVGYAFVTQKIAEASQQAPSPVATPADSGAPSAVSAADTPDPVVAPESIEAPSASSGAEQPAAAGTATHDQTQGGSPPLSAARAASASPPEEATSSDPNAQAAASVVGDPSSTQQISDAMNAASTNGQPVRWHADKLHGYAVPSAPDASGCRMVQVSVDETGAKSAAVKLCP